MTTTERSLVLVKPDGFSRGLTGEVLRRIEAKGYALVALAITTPDRERLARHYAEHEGKPFYEPLVEFMSSGPVTAVVIEGHRCIEGFRALAGATDPTAALPGTIRGDLGRDWGLKVQQNIVHGSDSPESVGPRDRDLVPRPVTSRAWRARRAEIVWGCCTPEGATIVHDHGCRRPRERHQRVTPASLVTRSATRGGWPSNPTGASRESPA